MDGRRSLAEYASKRSGARGRCSLWLVLGTRALVPAREEDRQTMLEADGRHNTQPVKQEKLSVLQILEGQEQRRREGLRIRRTRNTVCKPGCTGSTVERLRL